MIEVFVAFTKGTDIARLERTLEAWDLSGLEPIAIQCGLHKFEIHRRVTAENVSRGTYILADLDYGPLEEEFGDIATRAIAAAPDVGMILPERLVAAVVCRKGIITHWPTPMTATYHTEHQKAYERLGYKTITCPLIHCRPLVGSLPSLSGTGKPD